MVCGEGEVEEWADEEGNDLDEPVMVVDGCLGLGADVIEVLEPTAVPGLRVDKYESIL